MKCAVYIPGLGYDRTDLSVKAYALRMMKAIDENDPDPSKTYRIESSDCGYDSDGSVADAVSLFEISGGSEKEIYRFYEFRYGAFLTGRFDRSNILYRFVALLFVLVTRFASVIRSLFSFKDEINGKSKIQALYFTFIYVLFALYLLLLVPSLLGMLAGFAGKIPSLANLTAGIEQFQVWYEAVLASFAAFMLLTPNTKSVASAMAIEYLAANQYLSIGDRRLLIMGKLNRLIEVVSEEAEDSGIEVHAYSFGSLLALDLLFPSESEPSYRIKNSVNGLVTIGCPFDFVQIYWGNYFADRKYDYLSLQWWRNIHSDLDVLSTKFDNFPVKQRSFVDADAFWERVAPVDITYNMVNPRRVSLFQMFLFYGLKAHRMYWDEHADAKSCLSTLV